MPFVTSVSRAGRQGFLLGVESISSLLQSTSSKSPHFRLHRIKNAQEKYSTNRPLFLLSQTSKEHHLLYTYPDKAFAMSIRYHHLGSFASVEFHSATTGDKHITEDLCRMKSLPTRGQNRFCWSQIKRPLSQITSSFFGPPCSSRYISQPLEAHTRKSTSPTVFSGWCTYPRTKSSLHRVR